MCLALTFPEMTQGLPSTRGMFESTSAASGEIGTVRAPALESARSSSRASSSTSCQRSVRISFSRQPVSSSSRIAATAWIETPMRVSASASVRPRRRNSSSERNRSRRRSLFFTTGRHGLLASGSCLRSSAAFQMRARMSTAWFAIAGVARRE